MAEQGRDGLSPDFIRWAAGEVLIVTVERRRDGTRRRLLVRVPEEGPCQRPGSPAGCGWWCAYRLGGEEGRARGPCPACPDAASAEETR